MCKTIIEASTMSCAPRLQYCWLWRTFHMQ